MKIIRGLSKITKRLTANVATLGVFDGVHLGHQAILKETLRQARKSGIKSLCVTFWPNPKKSPLLYSLEHRLDLIERIGFDICLVVNFSKSFSLLNPESFIKNILIGKLNTKQLIIGNGFRFGRGKCADAETLIGYSNKYGFKVKEIELLKIGNHNISSTRIRDFISRGRLLDAEGLLGRPVAVYGTVKRGLKFAGKLGFPTANINPHHEVLPPNGIYAVNVIFNNNSYPGVCYIGTRPSLNLKELVVEVHIFDFSGNIYERDIYIEFKKFIRKEAKFKNFSLLKFRIKKDLKTAKSLF
jgi:riboflavin kinase/FMN adenylyltransferase